tara:strand:+ start:2176 stop:2397 length:222 start_codon:yes stop_codon:yes gene_type:complete
MVIKFNKDDSKDWKAFRVSKKATISREEFTMVCELHSKYYNHKLHKPCTCSPTIIKRWIKELNLVWDNSKTNL